MPRAKSRPSAKTFFLTFALLLMPAAYAAAAAPLTTPPLLSIAGGAVGCSAANIGSTPLTLTVEVVQGWDGVPYNTCIGTINPGTALNCVTGVGLSNLFYCRFAGGTKKTLRAAINVLDTSMMLTTALPAL